MPSMVVRRSLGLAWGAGSIMGSALIMEHAVNTGGWWTALLPGLFLGLVAAIFLGSAALGWAMDRLARPDAGPH